MTNSLNAVKVSLKQGTESFHADGNALLVTLFDFWRWSSSDLLNNRMRGIIAEFLVAHALGLTIGTRVEWNAYDLRTTTGLKIEVKSAAYLQSWYQKKLSPIKFNIGITLGWDAETNTYATEKYRQADVYVFCLLKHKDKATVDPLNVTQWIFYILPTTVLNENLSPTQRTMSISTLMRLKPRLATYDELKQVIKETEYQLKKIK